MLFSDLPQNLLFSVSLRSDPSGIPWDSHFPPRAPNHPSAASSARLFMWSKEAGICRQKGWPALNMNVEINEWANWWLITRLAWKRWRQVGRIWIPFCSVSYGRLPGGGDVLKSSSRLTTSLVRKEGQKVCPNSGRAGLWSPERKHDLFKVTQHISDIAGLKTDLTSGQVLWSPDSSTFPTDLHGGGAPWIGKSDWPSSPRVFFPEKRNRN